MIHPAYRAFFGYRRKKYASILLKPGTKHGFRLTHYIDEHDTSAVINKVLGEIKEHVDHLPHLDFYANGKSLKHYYTKQFKKQLRAEYLMRIDPLHEVVVGRCVAVHSLGIICTHDNVWLQLEF